MAILDWIKIYKLLGLNIANKTCSCKTEIMSNVDSQINSFSVTLKISSGVEIVYVIHNFERDLQAVFDVFLHDQKISNLALDERQHWIQKEGVLLSFEIENIGSAIERYYQDFFSAQM